MLLESTVYSISFNQPSPEHKLQEPCKYERNVATWDTSIIIPTILQHGHWSLSDFEDEGHAVDHDTDIS